MTKRLPTGFASPLILLAVGLLLGIGVTFTYFQFKSKPAPQPQQTTTSQSTATPAPVTQSTPTSDETANWKTYTNRQNKFSFKYPPDWGSRDIPDGRENKGVIVDDPVKTADIKSGSEILTKGASFTVDIWQDYNGEFKKAKDYDNYAFLSLDKLVRRFVFYEGAGFTNIKDIKIEQKGYTLNGVEGTFYNGSFLDNDANSLTTLEVFAFTKTINGKRFAFMLTQSVSSVSQLASEKKFEYDKTLNQILSTFKFTE